MTESRRRICRPSGAAVVTCDCPSHEVHTYRHIILAVISPGKSIRQWKTSRTITGHGNSIYVGNLYITTIPPQVLQNPALQTLQSTTSVRTHISSQHVWYLFSNLLRGLRVMGFSVAGTWKCYSSYGPLNH